MRQNKSPVSGVRARMGIFRCFLLAMKQCPIAAQIAGSIGILQCCVLTLFFHI